MRGVRPVQGEAAVALAEQARGWTPWVLAPDDGPSDEGARETLGAFDGARPMGWLVWDRRGRVEGLAVDGEDRAVAAALLEAVRGRARGARLGSVTARAARWHDGLWRTWDRGATVEAGGVDAVVRATVAPLSRARRVFVVGSSGSGKSTLAAHLARSLGRPRVDLDTVAFVDQAGTRRDVADSVARVEAADPEGGAVIEGCYADLIGALGTVRDHLIWLDLPVPVCVARARGRAWEPHKWPSAEAQDAFLPTLIRFIEAYPTQEGPTGRPAHQALFEGFAGVRSWWRSDVDRREG